MFIYQLTQVTMKYKQTVYFTYFFQMLFYKKNLCRCWNQWNRHKFVETFPREVYIHVFFSSQKFQNISDIEWRGQK